MDASKISAVIIAKNAEGLLEDCLKSLSWVSEVILVDSGSEDETVNIAKRFGAKINRVKNGNFSDWRNIGAKNSRAEWLLYVDSDERITPQLKQEISKSDLKLSAYAIPRRNIFLGQVMHWGGWRPDYVLRLIKKSTLGTWRGELHEQPEIKGEVGKLKEAMLHISHRTLSEMVDKTNAWSEVEAKLLYESHHPKMTCWRFVSVALREFWFRGVLKLGFLDGTVGIIEIIYQMFSRMITYAKLWEMQVSNKPLTINH